MSVKDNRSTISPTLVKYYTTTGSGIPEPVTVSFTANNGDILLIWEVHRVSTDSFKPAIKSWSVSSATETLVFLSRDIANVPATLTDNPPADSTLMICKVSGSGTITASYENKYYERKFWIFKLN